MPSYITHEAVLRELEDQFPDKKWDEAMVYRWCQQIETLYIADPDAMWKYMEIPLNVVNNSKFYLPDNLYKLLDVFDKNNNNVRVRYNRQGNVVKNLYNFEGDVIWVNYIGTPMNTKTCIPYIHETHFIACVTLCQLNGFKAESLYTQSGINLSTYNTWEQRFDGMIQAPKADVRDWGAQEFADMTIIMGDEIPKIGFQPLAHKYTNNATSV